MLKYLNEFVSGSDYKGVYFDSLMDRLLFTKTLLDVTDFGADIYIYSPATKEAGRPEGRNCSSAVINMSTLKSVTTSGG